MKALVQRVAEASVVVDHSVVAAIRAGLLIFLGVSKSDTSTDAVYLADKCSALRVFEDGAGKMNLSVADTGLEILVVSQFTLCADTRKGNRPSFTDAASPQLAENLYNAFIQDLRVSLGDDRVKTGVFRAMMDVHLVNDGPVTFLLESR